MCELAFNPLGGIGRHPSRLGARHRQVKIAHFPGLRLALRRPVSQAGKILFRWALVLSSTAPSPTLAGALPRRENDFARLRHKAAWGKCGLRPENYRALGHPGIHAAAWIPTFPAPGKAIALNALTKHSRPLGAHPAFASVGCSQN